MKKETEEIVYYYIKQQLGNLKITKPVTIKFIWQEENKKRDLDNIAFAKKFILDALVTAEVLKNDSAKEVIGFKDEFKYAKKSLVEVEIREI